MQFILCSILKLSHNTLNTVVTTFECTCTCTVGAWGKMEPPPPSKRESPTCTVTLRDISGSRLPDQIHMKSQYIKRS